MADIIDVHARDAISELTNAELGRFMAANGDRAGRRYCTGWTGHPGSRRVHVDPVAAHPA